MIWTRLSALIVKELLAAFRDFRARIALIAPPIVHGPQAFEEGVAEVADQRATVVVV